MPVPEHVPTDALRAKVEGLSCAGIRQERIAKHIGIDERTLVKYYSHELESALEERIALLGSNVYADALEGDKNERKFYLQTRGGWVPPKAVEEKLDKTNSLLEQVIDKL